MALLALISFCFVAISSTVPSCTALTYQTSLSRPIILGPGGVHNQNEALSFPIGHIGIRSFAAELVDEFGVSVPLTNVYLHHWIVMKVQVADSFGAASQQKLVSDKFRSLHSPHAAESELAHAASANEVDSVKVDPIGGMCENHALEQWFGIGSETRHTPLSFPAPYAVEAGSPAGIPYRYSERWWAQIHAIDIRGAVSPRRCLECSCAAFNATFDILGRAIPAGYPGGLLCCHEKVTCALREGFVGAKKEYRLKYTIGYVPFDTCVVPLKVFQLDITDNGLPMALGGKSCQVEFDVDKCDPSSNGEASCHVLMEQTVHFPSSVRLVYVAGHQHVGGRGISLHRKGGSVICDSHPIYGNGTTAGNEAGFLVGMEVCYFGDDHPNNRIEAGTPLTFRSLYSREQEHTGVMGLIYMAVALDGDYTAPANGRCERESWMPRKFGGVASQ